MPVFVDSHAHLSMEDFDGDREEVITRAREQGVEAILCPAELTEAHNLQVTLDLVEKHDGIIAAAGVHPHRAKKFTEAHARKIKELAEAGKICAVGEIGLDFHYNFSPPERQVEVFGKQLNIAQSLGLPVVVHSRLASGEIVRVVEDEDFDRGGILHCFTESLDFAQRMLGSRFFISFSGILTFLQAHALRAVAKEIPLDRLLIETDSPYLVPVPHRGKLKRNEPVYVKEVAATLAALKGISLSQLAETTTQNFTSLFCLNFKKRDVNIVPPTDRHG